MDIESVISLIEIEYYKIFKKNIPILNIDNKYGDTGYIDFINVNDFKNNNYPILLRGIDSSNRKFLSICYDVSIQKYDEDLSKNKKIKNKEVGTIFQRYSDREYCLAYGTCYGLNTFFYDSRIREKKDIELIINRIKKLLLGEIIYDFDEDRDNYLGDGKMCLSLECIRDNIKNILNNFTINDISNLILDYF